MKINPGSKIIQGAVFAFLLAGTAVKSSAGPSSKGSEQWFTIGSKHSCNHCGGEITVVQGKTDASMEHNGSMYGEDAAFCCATSAATPKKK